MLAVSEIFGPTFQGEGPHAGKRCWFLRLAGCNLHCRWCDSAYTWRFSDKHEHIDERVYDRSSEVHRMSPDSVAERIVASGTRRLVITGGEPLLQQHALYQVLREIVWSKAKRYPVDFEVETAGTIQPLDKFNRLYTQWNVSPKMANSGNLPVERFKPDVIRWFGAQKYVAFKFVVETVDDLNEAQKIVDFSRVHPTKVWVMPQGVTRLGIEGRAQQLADEVLARGWNMSMRMHISLWGNKRGV